MIKYGLSKNNFGYFVNLCDIVVMIKIYKNTRASVSISETNHVSSTCAKLASGHSSGALMMSTHVSRFPGRKNGDGTFQCRTIYLQGQLI
jgi:hypothetical protein